MPLYGEVDRIDPDGNIWVDVERGEQKANIKVDSDILRKRA